MNGGSVRIISFRIAPAARVLAIIYAMFGLISVPTSLLVGAKQIILPVGVFAPLLNLTFNLHLPLPTHFLTGILSTAAATLCYSGSGWLTGAAAVLVFNFVARLNGGIEASLLVKNTDSDKLSIHSSP
jgi:hypothetical protein